jgi:hypothetical protein
MAGKCRAKINSNASGSLSERVTQSTSDGTGSITLTVPEARDQVSGVSAGADSSRDIPEHSRTRQDYRL